MGGMTKAVAVGLGQAARSRRARPRSRRASTRGEDVIVGVNKYKLERGSADRRSARSTTRAVRESQIARLRDVRARRDATAVEAALAALTDARAHAARATCSTLCDRRDARARHGRRDDRRAREGLGPLPRRHADGLRRLRRGLRAGRQAGRRCKAEIERLRRASEGRRPRDHDRQARPGRARPRRQGGRHRVRRPRLRRRHRPAVPDARGSARGRRSRTTCTRSASRRSPPATRRWCRRSSRRCATQGADDIVVFVGGVIPQQDYEFLDDAGVAGHLRPRHADPGERRRTCSSRSARRASSPCSRLERAASRCGRRARPTQAAARSERRAHAADGVRAATGARSPRRSRCSSRRAPTTARAPTRCSTALLPHTGRAFRIGITGAPGRRQVDVHRGARPASDRARPSRRGARGRSVERDLRRLDPRRQDAHGAPRRVEPNAFIRPSPSGGTLGGVAREDARGDAASCEAAGYDIVIVETVGVGQSETAVAGMTDVFVLLQLPNAGDDLQAIKTGIIELADLVVVNKADLDPRPPSSRAGADRERALDCCGRATRGWAPPVLTISAADRRGRRRVLGRRSSAIAQRRRRTARSRRGASAQALAWMWALIEPACTRASTQHPRRAPGRSPRCAQQ